MRRDAAVMRVPFPESDAEIESGVLELIAANGKRNATLRVIVVRNRGGAWEGPGIDRPYDLIAFTTDLKDWGASVRLGLVPNGRHAGSPFAGAKVLSWSHNLALYEDAQSRGLDEVVLLNEHGQVSECTSANLFISRGNRIWTPPLASGCLPGVTRQILLEEVRVPGIEIGEMDLAPRDLETADEVFITSTTRGLLPVRAIEGLQIRSEGVAREPVERGFARFVEDYVARASARQPA
jgi:branched-chain amino acid aminotransferase